jgi:lipopolysaccharide assembly outer membrane protein LptD (OstA)
MNDALDSGYWRFYRLKNIPEDRRDITRLRFTVFPKCLVVQAEKTLISKDKMSLEGNVTLTYGKYKIKADRLEYDPEKRSGFADGSVLMNIASGEYISKKCLIFSFLDDGVFRNRFWENN